MYESQRDQLAGQQFNLDQTSFAIETVKNTQVTVAAMKDATKTLKMEQKKISLAELEDMQDDMEGWYPFLKRDCWSITSSINMHSGNRFVGGRGRD